MELVERQKGALIRRPSNLLPISSTGCAFTSHELPCCWCKLCLPLNVLVGPWLEENTIPSMAGSILLDRREAFQSSDWAHTGTRE